MSTWPIRNLDSLKGQVIECKVIKLNKKRNNIVLSRRVIIEEQRKPISKVKPWRRWPKGLLFPARSKTLPITGFLSDLGGIDGLLHISDITWGRPKHPSHYFSVGQEIQVKVLKYDAESGRVSLGQNN